MADDERALSSRLAPVLTVAVLLVAGSLVPKGATKPTGSRIARDEMVPSYERRDHREPARPRLAATSGATRAAARPRQSKVDLAVGRGGRSVDLAAYEDLGSWIDIYDEWQWAHPRHAVAKLHERGARTLFLQTSNYGADRAIFKPRQTEKFLKAAHRRKMKVVAWYVPSFARPRVDYQRSKAAIRFEADGHRFDSFGLDIEATVVRNIYWRNKRLLKLSAQIRKLVGPEYPLGAITPDAVEALYWPDFPYRRVDAIYDVFVPMGYFSFRVSGYKAVKKYTLTSIRNIRRRTGDPDVPIHLIGGIGGETKGAEVKGFVRALRSKDVLGASYYDVAVTSEEEWEQLEAIVPEPEPEPTASDPERYDDVPVVPDPIPTAAAVAGIDSTKAAEGKQKNKHKKHESKNRKKHESKNRKKHESKKRAKDRRDKRP